MNLAPGRLKIIVIIVVFLAALLSGWKLYHEIQSRAHDRQINTACQRAAIYQGVPGEFTSDERLCKEAGLKAAE